jgi:hypothetical protein
MALPRFIYKNLIRDGEIIAVSSEHPQYPVENLQDDNLDAELSWRSRYGSGTGTGRFVIAASNSKIDFDEGGAELTATLTAATYNGQTLATEIKTQMDAAGGTYTVSYSESTGKFTIARAAGNFTLRWNTGTNKANGAAATLGFSAAADDTGADTYDSDTMVIHTSEEFDVDFGAAIAYDSIAIQGHNLTASAVIVVYGADDSAFTTNVVSDTLTHNDSNIFEFLGTARTKRYCRFKVTDVANPSGYVQVTVAVAGSYFQPIRYFSPYNEGPVDESALEKSPSNSVFTIQEREMLDVRELSLKNLSTANAATIKLMMAEVGIRKAFWLCLDSTAANTNSYWLRLTETIPPQMGAAYSQWDWECPTEEVI